MGNSLAGNEELDHEDILTKDKARHCGRDSTCSFGFGSVEDWERIQELWVNQDIRAVAIVVEDWLRAVEGGGGAGLVVGERSERVQLWWGVDDGRRLHG